MELLNRRLRMLLYVAIDIIGVTLASIIALWACFKVSGTLNFDGIMVIKHFRVANSLKNDRRKPLTYPEIAKQLTILKNRCYSTVPEASCKTLYELHPDSGLEKNGIQMESQPNRTEENLTEPNLTEDNSAEGSRTQVPPDPSAQLRFVRGRLGKGVLLLSDGQIENLLERLGLDAFDYYTNKLSTLLQEGKVKSRNHYATIMKWYLEDTEV